ncbi:MAG: hypothetical protein ACMZHY_01655 [Enterobacterales bacterium]
MRKFWSLKFKVNKSTIIPRHETECIVQQFLKLIKNKKANILNLGTGT